MIGIVGKEILAMRNIDTGEINIDTDKAGLYPATAALVQVDGKGLDVLSKDDTITKAGVDVDKGVLSGKDLHFRTWAIYPTSDKHVWYQYVQWSPADGSRLIIRQGYGQSGPYKLLESLWHRSRHPNDIQGSRLRNN